MESADNKLESKEKVSLYEAADGLRKENSDTPGLILAIAKFIRNRLPFAEENQPKTIFESRFTPAEEAYEKGMVSCGALSNIGAAMLRHLGFEVKLIDGESLESETHAWISVRDLETGTWQEYDLARKDLSIPPTHKKKYEVESWEEIRDVLTKENDARRAKKKQKSEKFND